MDLIDFDSKNGESDVKCFDGSWEHTTRKLGQFSSVIRFSGSTVLVFEIKLSSLMTRFVPWEEGFFI